MEKVTVLWADDEIDLLKPHILFLEDKGYEVHTATNGNAVMEIIKKHDFDIIFLDENMPGLTGIETLVKIKNLHPNLPVVMITKSEEESIMEEAIGSKISDYLIKPVNPNQILLAIKKNLENKRLIVEKTNSAYQQEFQKIGMRLSENLNYNEWIDIYKKIIFWELEFDNAKDESMVEILKMQKLEANNLFAKFYEKNYQSWLNGKASDIPVLSPTLIRKKVIPLLSSENPVFFILIDNLRYDQWKILQPVIEETFRVAEDQLYFSILPTVTQYARNSLFAGLMPFEIQNLHPQYWLNDEEEGTKNSFESELLGEQLKRITGKEIKYSYNKILNYTAGSKFSENINNLFNNKLNVLVYNFVDTLSHARTEMEIIRELAKDESAYRSITLSWFEHSPLLEILKQLAGKKLNIIITTDHGSVFVHNAVKVLGDRNTTANLRYKQGRALQYNKKEVFEIRNPLEFYLPKTNISSSYIFTRGYDFFAYPNNYNHYVNYYKNTFQHGGISMEEIMIPVITLNDK
jgi:DNA-binding response OmpR family regulator